MGAHFHFGPNEDEGELALQLQLAEEKGYAFAPDALRKIVGGRDALGERLLDLSWKQTALAGGKPVTAIGVQETWDAFGHHLRQLIDVPDTE